MACGLFLRVLTWLAYPLAIFFGLQLFEPRYVALIIAGILLLRRWSDADRFLGGLTRIDQTIIATLLGFSVLTFATNSEFLLRLYPAATNLSMLLLFGLSLKFTPSMVERFARLAEPGLPPAGVLYTRRVTQVWCSFFVANGGLALYTAINSSREVWALYNGLISYILMGILFACELFFRRRYRTRSATI